MTTLSTTQPKNRSQAQICFHSIFHTQIYYYYCICRLITATFITLRKRNWIRRPIMARYIWCTYIYWHFHFHLSSEFAHSIVWWLAGWLALLIVCDKIHIYVSCVSTVHAMSICHPAIKKIVKRNCHIHKFIYHGMGEGSWAGGMVDMVHYHK